MGVNWKRVWYILNIRKIIRFIAIRSQTPHIALSHQAIHWRTQASLKSEQVYHEHARFYLSEIKQMNSMQSKCFSISFWIFCKLNQNQKVIHAQEALSCTHWHPVFDHSFVRSSISSEHDKGLSNVTFNSLLLDSYNAESNSLGDWSALTDSDDISNSGSAESWGQVSW